MNPPKRFPVRFVSGAIGLETAHIAARLFHSYVHASNRHDYADRQLEAWAPSDERSREALASRLCGRYAVVAMSHARMVGFATLLFEDCREAEFDMLFVAPDAQHFGIGSRIADMIERKAVSEGAESMRAYVSLTARPFFENRGYEIVRGNVALRKGVEIPNFLMRKVLRDGLRA